MEYIGYALCLFSIILSTVSICLSTNRNEKFSDYSLTYRNENINLHDIKDIKRIVQDLQISMESKIGILSGRMDRQYSDLCAKIAVQDAEFKMFVKCGQLNGNPECIRDAKER